MGIVFENYTKTIKKSRILCNINAVFEAGKIYGIHGRNGSGKTMLLRAACGLIRATSGSVTVEGKVLGKDQDFPDNVGVLIENSRFPAGLTAYENLKILASIRNRIDDDAIMEIIDRVGLLEYQNKKYRQYSLGMKQKLGIAAALMERPSVILLDEPTNALDDEGVERFREVIVNEKKMGAVIMITSHDKEELAAICDEQIEMRDGRLEA